MLGEKHIPLNKIFIPKKLEYAGRRQLNEFPEHR